MHSFLPSAPVEHSRLKLASISFQNSDIWQHVSLPFTPDKNNSSITLRPPERLIYICDFDSYCFAQEFRIYYLDTLQECGVMYLLQCKLWSQYISNHQISLFCGRRIGEAQAFPFTSRSFLSSSGICDWEEVGNKMQTLYILIRLVADIIEF